jgi:hypothetical protein
MPSRARLLATAARIVSLLLCAHATVHGQQASASRPTLSVVNHSTRSRAGPTVQSASVGVHLAEAPELQPLPVAALAGPGASAEARRNVLIVATVLVITASIIGGEKGLTLGALAGLVGLIAAVS